MLSEAANLLDAIASDNGVTKHPAGLRLYNQKYYLVRHNDNGNGTKTIYLKKVKLFLLRSTEEPACASHVTSLLSEPSTPKTKWKTVSLKTPENLTREFKHLLSSLLKVEIDRI